MSNKQVRHVPIAQRQQFDADAVPPETRALIIDEFLLQQAWLRQQQIDEAVASQQQFQQGSQVEQWAARRNRADANWNKLFLIVGVGFVLFWAVVIGFGAISYALSSS